MVVSPRRLASLALVLITGLGTLGCASSPPTPPTPTLGPEQQDLNPVPVGELRRPATYSMLAVLLPEGQVPLPIVEAISAAAAKHERVITKDTDDLASGGVLLTAHPVATIVNFDVVDFDVLGFSAEESAKIRRATLALTMVVAGPAEALALVHRQAADIARAALKAAPEAWLLDGGTFQIFTADRFNEFRPQGFPLEVERLITVMVDDSKPALRLETLGMERLGLPELRMVDVPRPLVDRAVALFNAAAQLLVEQGELETKGELVIDLSTARMPHLRELHEDAKTAGGGHAVTLTAYWDSTQRDEDSDPVIRLDLKGAPGDRAAAFETVLAQVFGVETPD